MIKKYALLALSLVALPGLNHADAASQCQMATAVPRGAVNRVEADASTAIRVLAPSFFGFNLEWLEFQKGMLWDSNAHRVLPGVVDIFKAFPGAVYRFPGGTNSNHIDWRDAVGPVANRAPRKQVSWLAPLRAEFGLDEYLHFVKDVKGQAWYVANLYGLLDGAADPAQLAVNAGRLAAYAKERETEGFPPILRWELGNELDRAQYKWSPERLANTALQVSAAIAQSAPGSKFVHLQQEYPAQAAKGFTAIRYNKELRAPLAVLKPEFAMHFYFDGPPDAPPADYFLKQLCQVVDGAKAEGSQGKVWVTEQGRVPNAFWAKTPKELWPETANLQAAVSIADMLIALTQVPEAQGAFTHSLVASSSPWPLVHPRSNGTVDPSVTLLGMTVLRQSMLPDVLATKQVSSANGTLGASYLVRSAVLADASRENFTLWAINRSPDSQPLEFQLKNAKGQVRFQSVENISDEQTNASNYASGTRIVIQNNRVSAALKSDGVWSVSLPPNSVSALRFTALK